MKISAFFAEFYLLKICKFTDHLPLIGVIPSGLNIRIKLRIVLYQ